MSGELYKRPFIGAIVHYVKIEDYDLDDNPIRTCLAAIVTRMPASYAKPDSVDLAAIRAPKWDSEPHTTHDAGNGEMTWHWPEECLSDRRENDGDES